MIDNSVEELPEQRIAQREPEATGEVPSSRSCQVEAAPAIDDDDRYERMPCTD
jgi:hypothetical protein